MAPASALTGFQSAVLDWSRAGGGWRDLPWRQTRDPWAILVSEVMLQQTQAARVVARWREFLTAFPTPAACAAAPRGAVIDRWIGLGYNRRAVQLHRTAVEVVDRFGGRLPGELAALRSLPGIGPYTARAVLAFAFEVDTAVVDTNVARVLARAVAGRALRPAEVQAVADAALPSGQGWRWNQAMLDLGAGHCTARRPGCADCPLPADDQCAWARARFAAPDPAVGSAGVSGRQSTFAGSDRQGRGRLVLALREGPIPLTALAVAAGWPDDEPRAARAAASLIADGLAIEVGGRLALPG